MWRVFGRLLYFDGLLFEDVNLREVSSLFFACYATSPYEERANYLSFSLRVLNAFQSAEKTLRCIDYSQRDAEIFIKCLFDLLAFVQTHDSIIHELCGAFVS